MFKVIIFNLIIATLPQKLSEIIQNFKKKLEIEQKVHKLKQNLIGKLFIDR